MFKGTLTESSQSPRHRKRASTLMVSLLAHTATVMVLLALPLVYYQALPSAELLTALIAVPLPKIDSPPPPPAQRHRRPTGGTPQVVHLTDFQVPTEIPQGIPEPPDVDPNLEWISGSGGQGPVGIPGGVPGGLPGVTKFGDMSVPSVAPPPPPVKRRPVRVSRLQSSKLVRRVEPVYPPLAARARLEGAVVLQATIDEVGEVSEVVVLRGHPLLNQAAVDAVRQWRYSPTILNGEPVSVITTVTVIFRLHR